MGGSLITGWDVKALLPHSWQGTNKGEQMI
jgi:hypothetical protein